MSSLSPALMKLIADKKAQHAKSGNAYTLKEGKNRIRVLPGWRKGATKGDVEQFFHDFGQHWIKDGKGQVQAVVGCAQATYQKPCEFCDEVNVALKGTTDDDTVKMLKEWASKKRVLVNALVRSSDKPNDVQVVELPWSAFGNIVGIMEEYAAELGNMLDLKTGIDFIIERSGKGLDTKYAVMPAPKSEPVDAKVLANLIDLDAYVAAEFDAKMLRARNAIAALLGGGSPASISPSASRLLGAPKLPATPAGGFVTIEGSSVIVDDEIPFDGPKPVVVAAAPVSAPASIAQPAPAPAVTVVQPPAAPVASAPAQAAATQPAPAPVVAAPPAALADDEISKMLDELRLD